ncbi:LuxR C-terminal-related transcriptional regulator [Zhongshania aliphaticivorans]|uniref:LuxR C-terminal-related transcriptional regulator n=1 Tax=Zhongshania aliphaticivorans TaxID=1470434 RepID=UPI00132F643E|nr:LuxR C-terminal-related transcriptional regulator [Zhongshania aliphaticivorans]
MWLSCDSADNDISRFLQVFLASIKEMPEGKAASIDTSISNASIADAIMAYFDALAQPIAVFMDGFEALENTAVVDLVIRGIESMPLGSVVVLATRVEPKLGLSGFRGSGQLTEIGVNELCFARDEVSELFRDRLGVQVGTEHLDTLHVQTEGWPTALWLAWQAMNDGRDVFNVLQDITRRNSTLACFLADEVMAFATPSLRDFLLRTSLAEEINYEIAAALSPSADVLWCLDECERLNLVFRYFDDRGEIYRFNTLLRESLYHSFCASQPSDIVAEAHLKACEYYMSNGRTTPAIRQAIKARRFDTAISLLNVELHQLLAWGRMRFLADVFEQLALAGELNNSLHIVLRAWCVNFTRGPSYAYSLIENLNIFEMESEARDCLLALRPMVLGMLDRIKEAREEVENASELISGKYPYAVAMLHQIDCSTSIITGNHLAARKAIDRARRIAKSSSGAFGILLAESSEATLDIMAGRLRQASARIQLANKEFRNSRTQPEHGVVISSILYGESLYESGKLDEARNLLERNISLVRDVGPPDALISSHIILSRLALSSGNIEGALEILTQLESDGYRLNLPRVIASAKLEYANLRIGLEDFSGAKAILNEGLSIFDWSNVHSYWWIGNDTLYPAIVSARLHIRSGQPAKAMDGLKEELRHADRQSRERRALKIRILMAEALFLTGRKKAALRSMLRVIRTVKIEGYVSTLKEEGATVGSLHVEAGRSAESGPSINSNLTESSLSPLIGQTGDKLSPKEFIALQYLAKGLSNSQIAGAMFVSESTVRSHLRSINVKLNAKNRTQAIIIAKKMHIIN